MKAVFDTSSLLAIVGYYIPCQKDNQLVDFFREKFLSGEFLLLDKVFDEIQLVANGVVLEYLTFLKEPQLRIGTDSILPSRAFMGLASNQFCNKDVLKSKGLNEIEIETELTRFLNSADGRLLLYTYDKKRRGEEIILVTEESNRNNDGKPYRKLPICCNHMQVKCSTLPQFLKNYDGFRFSDYLI